MALFILGLTMLTVIQFSYVLVVGAFVAVWSQSAWAYRIWYSSLPARLNEFLNTPPVRGNLPLKHSGSQGGTR